VTYLRQCSDNSQLRLLILELDVNINSWIWLVTAGRLGTYASLLCCVLVDVWIFFHFLGTDEGISRLEGDSIYPSGARGTAASIVRAPGRQTEITTQTESYCSFIYYRQLFLIFKDYGTSFWLYVLCFVCV
jgi:hypothetical protein